MVLNQQGSKADGGYYYQEYSADPDQARGGFAAAGSERRRVRSSKARLIRRAGFGFWRGSSAVGASAGFGVRGSGFGVRGSGFGVRGSGFGDERSPPRLRPSPACGQFPRAGRGEPDGGWI